MASKPDRPPSGAKPEREPDPRTDELSRVREALSGLLYGAVTVVVHDGAVVQIERTEKLRFGRSSPGG